MARSQKELVTLDAIRAELRTAAAKFLREVEKEHPGETLYGFVFEISCEGFAAHGAAATEEGLARYAEQWVAEEGGKLEKRQAAFRWGSPEDAWYSNPTLPLTSSTNFSVGPSSKSYTRCTMAP